MGRRGRVRPHSKKFKWVQRRLDKKKLEFLKRAENIFENKNASNNTSSTSPIDGESSNSNAEVSNCVIDKDDEEIIYEEIVGYFSNEEPEKRSDIEIETRENLTELNQSGRLDHCTEKEPEERSEIEIETREDLAELNQSGRLDHCTRKELKQTSSSIDNNSNETTHASNNLNFSYDIKYKAVIILSHDLDYYSEEEEQEEVKPTSNFHEIDEKSKIHKD